jgi:hypothetical protein
MPSLQHAVDFKELLRMEPDGGTTNIRNVKSEHWTGWLGAENRCVVPFNSFSEFCKAEGGDIWFALDESRPLACFAGVWTNWTSVRKVKEDENTNDLSAFLTTEPNVEVGAIHPFRAAPLGGESRSRTGHAADTAGGRHVTERLATCATCLATSGVPRTTDIARPTRLVRFVPILLKNSTVEAEGDR